MLRGQSPGQCSPSQRLICALGAPRCSFSGRGRQFRGGGGQKSDGRERLNQSVTAGHRMALRETGVARIAEEDEFEAIHGRRSVRRLTQLGRGGCPSLRSPKSQ